MNNNITKDEEAMATFTKVYQCYKTLISVNVQEYESAKTHLVFPILPPLLLSSLCQYAAKAFESESLFLEINASKEKNEDNSDLIIVGDIHGHILDLFRILKRFGAPPKKNRYLFLGDLVDRGQFSVETVILIFLMKVLYPKSVFVVRGNHEFQTMWPLCGFTRDIVQIYGNQNLILDFQNAFSYMPLGAIVCKKYFCVHGGIGPDMLTTNFFEHKRPIDGFEKDPVFGIVWSDPCETIDDFKPSTRGSGFFYGRKALNEFLQMYKLEMLIRGHQSIENGIQYYLENKVVTVFSASNYCGNAPNKAGVIIIKNRNQNIQNNSINNSNSQNYSNSTSPINLTDPNLANSSLDSNQNDLNKESNGVDDVCFETETYPAIRYIERSSATFLSSSSETSFQLNSRPMVVKSSLPPKPTAAHNNNNNVNNINNNNNKTNGNSHNLSSLSGINKNSLSSLPPIISTNRTSSSSTSTSSTTKPNANSGSSLRGSGSGVNPKLISPVPRASHSHPPSSRHHSQQITFRQKYQIQMQLQQKQQLMQMNGLSNTSPYFPSTTTSTAISNPSSLLFDENQQHQQIHEQQYDQDQFSQAQQNDKKKNTIYDKSYQNLNCRCRHFKELDDLSPPTAESTTAMDENEDTVAVLCRSSPVFPKSVTSSTSSEANLMPPISENINLKLSKKNKTSHESNSNINNINNISTNNNNANNINIFDDSEFNSTTASSLDYSKIDMNPNLYKMKTDPREAKVKASANWPMTQNPANRKK